MLPGTDEPRADDYFFHPTLKCCTYVPELRNFLVGAILSDTDRAAQPGRATVEKRVAAGVGVTPLAVGQPPVYALLYSQAESAFGRSETLACPHYLGDGGQCGIWSHRDAVCATWFCKHVRGELGRAFWIHSFRDLLNAVESELARWCVLQLHPREDQLRHLVDTVAWKGGKETVTGYSLDGRVEQKAYAKIWGEWRGREAEFYRRCAELVNPLSWADVLAISGPTARAYAQLTKQAYRQLLSSEVPPALEVGSFRLVHVRNGITRLTSYSGYDPLDVPANVMDLLQYFDGQPTEDALAAIAAERGFLVEPDLLRKMVDFGLLVPKQS
jgi:hypothetical protein